MGDLVSEIKSVSERGRASPQEAGCRQRSILVIWRLVLPVPTEVTCGGTHGVSFSSSATPDNITVSREWRQCQIAKQEIDTICHSESAAGARCKLGSKVKD